MSLYILHDTKCYHSYDYCCQMYYYCCDLLLAKENIKCDNLFFIQISQSIKMYFVFVCSCEAIKRNKKTSDQQWDTLIPLPPPPPPKKKKHVKNWSPEINKQTKYIRIMNMSRIVGIKKKWKFARKKKMKNICFRIILLQANVIIYYKVRRLCHSLC